MSLREDLQQLIRLQVAGSKVGHEAVAGAVTGDKAWGSNQAVLEVLTSYCGVSRTRSFALRMKSRISGAALEAG